MLLKFFSMNVYMILIKFLVLLPFASFSFLGEKKLKKAADEIRRLELGTIKNLFMAVQFHVRVARDAAAQDFF